MATTFFPHWKWTGKQLRAFKLPFTDNLYYKYPGAIPFLSTWYPPHFLSAFLSSFLSIDKSFVLLQLNVFLHYILSSILSYILFLKWCDPLVALFGSITLTYSGYCIKIQQPCIAYTLAWIPGIFLDGWLGILSMSMTLLAGYYPMLIYLFPFILLIHTKTVLLGILFALPQLIPFIWYFTKSVRWNEPNVPKFGKVPPQKLIELVLPLRPRIHTNSVMFMEMAIYMGLAILFIWFSSSRFWYVLAFGLAVSVSLIKPWQRIPARALYIVTLSLSVLATDGLQKLSLTSDILLIILLLQSFLLLFNSDIYPCFPFTQWWTKPSQKLYDVTGYITGRPNHPYQGAFRLKNA